MQPQTRSQPQSLSFRTADAPPASRAAPPPGVARARLRELLSSEAPMAGPVLLVAAHPDDEVIGAAGVLVRRGARDLTVVHLTDGAPRSLLDARGAGFARWDSYAAARRQELAAALDLVGLGADRRLELGVPDQGASHALELLARRLRTVLAERTPRLVLTHPYEGGHPDHDATAFAVHAALALSARETGAGAPPIAEFTSYHAGPGGLATGQFLPAEASEELLVLDAEQRRLRERMLDCFATQARTLRPFRNREIERYRVAPAYRFTEPPHAGRLFYEHFDWGMTGVRWRELARAALTALGLRDPP